MQFSLQQLHESSQHAQSHLWTVRFSGFDSVNRINGGGGVGKIFPCADVKEPVYTYNSETLTLPNDLELVIPRSVSYGGTLEVTFKEMSRYEIIKAITEEWVNDMHTPDTFKDIKNIVKKIQVDKYDRESSGPIYTSTYKVYPPDDLLYEGGSDLQLVTSSLSFKVVGCEKKFS